MPIVGDDRGWIAAACVVLVTIVAACSKEEPIGACTAPKLEQMTAKDGGTVTCACKGPCGCFYPDAGDTRCP